MKTTINFIFGVGNFFWFPLVLLKTYEWFSPHVGFEMPILTYLNVFLVYQILKLLNSNVGLALEMFNKEDKEDKLEYKSVVSFIIFSVTLIINFLIKTILL
jgi:hypothetical protein|tara:strand:+ start:4075 stop:4377 length:303 start_codon:yes stop_codon:yes gene_type:complete